MDRENFGGKAYLASLKNGRLDAGLISRILGTKPPMWLNWAMSCWAIGKGTPLPSRLMTMARLAEFEAKKYLMSLLYSSRFWFSSKLPSPLWTKKSNFKALSDREKSLQKR